MPGSDEESGNFADGGGFAAKSRLLASRVLLHPFDDSRDHFYTEIVDAIRVHGADVRSDIEELWRRMAFSDLITNVDDHLHNHGFLHTHDGQWNLAPAFDLNPFPERVRDLKTWISEETGPEATMVFVGLALSRVLLVEIRVKHPHQLFPKLVQQCLLVVVEFPFSVLIEGSGVPGVRNNEADDVYNVPLVK